MTKKYDALYILGSALKDEALDKALEKVRGEITRLNGEIVGTMAVLGPTRMEYGKVMAVMNYLHKYLEVILKNQE